MIIHVGMPRAASTAIEQFMAMQLKIAHADINELVWHKKRIDGAQYVRAESIIDGVRVINEQEWQHWLYQPGAWSKVNRISAFIDLEGNAKAVKDNYPDARILIVYRDADDFMRSVYRYAVHQLPWGKRSFAHYLATPSGLTHQLIGDGRKALEVFGEVFGWGQVCGLPYGMLVKDQNIFMAKLCRFCDVRPGPLPKINRSYGGLTLMAKRIFP